MEFLFVLNHVCQGTTIVKSCRQCSRKCAVTSSPAVFTPPIVTAVKAEILHFQEDIKERMPLIEEADTAKPFGTQAHKNILGFKMEF